VTSPERRSNVRGSLLGKAVTYPPFTAPTGEVAGSPLDDRRVAGHTDQI
jgi:hypothetical protein